MAKGYDQNNHLLRIDTILNDFNLFPEEAQFKGDPLLLIKLDGVEGISQLFAYDVVLLRDSGGHGDPFSNENPEKRPPIDVTRLIGTPVSIGARPVVPKKLPDPRHFLKRVGMFETFEDIVALDITQFIGNDRDFHVYRARIVPWVKVLTRDICYRIFEHKTVFEIIDAIADEAKKTYNNLFIDRSALKKFPYPKMEYCVQFGESTFSFMSRLMARFGIWYFFGHNEGNAEDETGILNETMILKNKSDIDAPGAKIEEVNVADDDPSFKEIAKIVRRFRPPERRVAEGGFNQLNPTRPFYQARPVAAEDDLLKSEPGPPADTKFSGTTSFAQPVFSQSDVLALADTASKQNESEVILFSGVSRNHSFAAGHKFKVLKEKFDPKDNEDAPLIAIVNHQFIIDSLSITGSDYNYVNIRLPLDVIFSPLFHFSFLDADAIDNTNNALYKASRWATTTAQSKIYTAVNPLSAPFPDQASGGDINFARFGLNGANLALTGLLGTAGPEAAMISPIIASADFQKAFSDAKNLVNFAVGVVAISDTPLHPPLPVAVRPTARGPHTAVVIGRDEGKGVLDVAEGKDIYADAIGRVRIRFPWDPGPPVSNSKLPPVFPFSESDKPTRVGGNTCWVRVVEGWAGQGYGTQFLPRIGQEVLVDFLDGDPEQPVIVGRLYNADRGFTNLPFPPKAYRGTTFNQVSELPVSGGGDFRFNGVKTDSVPTSTKDSQGDPKPLPPRFNLLRFDDTRDKEQYLIRSQGRLDITAFNHRYENISRDRNLTVGGKKITPPPKEIGGDYITKIFRHYHLHVGDPDFPTQSGNRVTKLEQNDQLFVKKGSELDTGTYSAVSGNYYLHVSGRPGSGGGKRDTIIDDKDSLLVKADLNQMISGNWSTALAKQMSVRSDTTIVLEAFTNISLVVGGSSIVITPSSIAITSPMVLINSGGPPPASPIVPPAPPVNDPSIPDPQNPTQADSGSSLDPPEWQK